MKQRKLTVLLGLLTLINFCLGHAEIQVQHPWSEPTILWTAINLQTGRGKSTFHKYLTEILEKVEDHIRSKNNEVKVMLLPHCTWEKFGELLANSGGRILGLFDELLSFFSTMNMYSSRRMQVTDSREYQDFLQLYTGKAKARETLGGNANYEMKRTAFTMLGFTQPTSALPIIQDIHNNAKGFTSRILWYFPKPVYSKLRDFQLSDEQYKLVEEFENQFVTFLADLYIHGESSYELRENGKKIEVDVFRTEFTLTDEAKAEFEKTHDEWENLCEKYPSDVLVGGLFSRGRSQILRLSAPLHILLSSYQSHEQDEQNNDNIQPDDTQDNEEVNMNDNHDDISKDVERNEAGEEGKKDDENGDDEIKDDDERDNDDDEESSIDTDTEITDKAIRIAFQIVKTSLHQICILNGRHDLTKKQMPDDQDSDVDPSQQQPTASVNKEAAECILLTPGPVVSSSELTKKYQFRKVAQKASMTVKKMAEITFTNLETMGLGHVETYPIRTNNTKVKFFIKEQVINRDEQMQMQFASKLSHFAIRLAAYQTAYEDTATGSNHLNDYEARRSRPETSNKRQRVADTQEK